MLFAAFAGFAFQTRIASVIAAHLAEIAVFAVVLSRAMFIGNVYQARQATYSFKSHV